MCVTSCSEIVDVRVTRNVGFFGRAAVAAAYVHGLAGRRAALDGPVTAPDVASALRAVIRDTLHGDTDQ